MDENRYVDNTGCEQVHYDTVNYQVANPVQRSNTSYMINRPWIIFSENPFPTLKMCEESLGFCHGRGWLACEVWFESAQLFNMEWNLFPNSTDAPNCC